MTRTPEQSKASNARYYAKHREQERARARANVEGRNLSRRKHMGIVDPPGDVHRGPCEICGRVPTPAQRANHCDHDHATGEFRGWLCKECNTKLAALDDRAWFEKAEAYRVAHQ